MLEILEAFEALGYFGAFWLFVFSSRARGATLAEWRGRGVIGRIIGLLEGAIAAGIGLLPVWIVWWIAA